MLKILGMVVAGAGFTVLVAVLFNLISDVTGGIRFTVVEEETARPRPKRLRPRRGMLDRVAGAGQPQPGVVPAPAMASEPSADDHHRLKWLTKMGFTTTEIDGEGHSKF